VLAKPVAACSRLSSTLSQLFEPQVQKIAVFTYRSPHFCFPWRSPCDYHPISSTDGKTIQCLPNSWQHVHLSIFNSFRVIRCLSQCVSPKIAIFTTFLPRDAMHKCGLCCHAVSVRPSVCPSVTFVSCAKTNKDIFEFFSPSGSDTILVFPHQRGADIPTGTPLTGASNARGYDKMTTFSQISRSISETVKVRWAHAARQFVSIEFSFHPYNI